MKHVNRGEFLGTRIPLPPLEEQRRIAAILDKVAALIASAEQTICLSQYLKKSAVDDFLASTNRDGNSERVKICDVANMITGFPFKSACYTDSAAHTRLCRGINVLPGRVEWRQVARWPAVTPELRSYQIQEDDILIAMDRPWIGEGFKIAKARPGDVPSLLVQRVARLRAGDKILPRILYEVLSSKAFEAHCTPTETTVPHISPIEIREYEFPLPLLEVQKELDLILAGIEGIQLAMNQRATLLKEKLSAISREYFL
jgi:type I restriction enzyme S subunit